MASTDALPVPRKNAAYRVTFPIYKSDGTLITGAAGLDSEVDKDAAGFADCSNEATEIATSSGVYYLDLTSSEMNADTVTVLVKSSTTGAVPVVLTLYPQEAGDVRVNATYWNDAAVATPTVAGVPEVDVTHMAGGTANVLNLNASASTIIRGTVDNTAHTPSATEFEADDITEATADHYNGRLVIFTSGALLGQAARINDYAIASGRGHFTVSTLTEAPANNDTFVLV